MSIFKYLITCLFIFMASCAALQPNRVQEIHFGNGGGFTGACTTYILKSDGTLLKNDSIIRKIKTKETTPLLTQAEECLTVPPTVKPGNTYQFLLIKTKNQNVYSAWQFGASIDKQIKTLYLNLFNLITHETN